MFTQGKTSIEHKYSWNMISRRQMRREMNRHGRPIVGNQDEMPLLTPKQYLGISRAQRRRPRIANLPNNHFRTVFF